MSTDIVISRATPIVVVEQSSYQVDVSNPAEITIEKAPTVITIDQMVIQGAPGVDGETPDLSLSSNIDLIVAGLSGKITATQLHNDLTSEIDKISVGATSIEAKLALLETADDLLNSSLGEAGTRITNAENADVLLDQRIDTLEVDYTSLDDALTAQITALNTVTGRVTTVEGNIVAQAAQFDALATSVSDLDDGLAAQAVIINSHTTAINALVDGGEVDFTAIVEDIAQLQADVGDNTAAIQVEQSVRAQVVGAIWDSLTTYVPGMTVVYASNLYRSLTTNTNKDPVTYPSDWTAISGTVYSQYTVKLDANGKVAGFGLMNDGSSSVFEIVADRFAVCNTSGAGTKTPFIVDATYGVIMDTALIKNLTATNIEVGSLTGDLLASGTSVTETNIIGGVLKSSDSLFYADMGNKIMTMADGLGNAVEITPAIVSYIRNNTAYYGITRIASGIAANGTYVSFSPAFVTVPEVYIVPINFTTYKASAAGYDQSISMSAANVSQNGFSVTCYTATGMPLTRFYDADIGFGYNSYGTFYSATDEIILSLVLSAYSSTTVESVYREYGVALEVQYYNGSTGVWTTLVYASAIYKNQIFTTPQLPTGYTHGMRVRLYANPIYSYVSVISSHTHTYSLSSSYTGGTVSWLAIERAS